MARVQSSARLHEKTVQELAKGRKMTPKRSRTVRGNPVVSIKVDPRVWATARRMMGRDGYTRIEVVSEEEVIVR